MKKQLLAAVALLAISMNLSASLGGLVEDIVDAPGDVVYGRGDYYDRDGYRGDGWNRRYDDRGYRHGLFGHRYRD